MCLPIIQISYDFKQIDFTLLLCRDLKIYKSMGNSPLRIILFDGVCNLCNNMVRFIIKRDPFAKFKFTALQSDQGLQILKQFEFQSDKSDFIIYIRGEKCFVKSTAILYILKDLGGIWMLYFLFILIPVFIRDFFYNILARKRYQLFGRQKNCIVPTPDIKKRFLPL
jgi:predicted DCC family thiol-disulfide oxidoreductase YuxK